MVCAGRGGSSSGVKAGGSMDALGVTVEGNNVSSAGDGRGSDEGKEGAHINSD